MGRMTKALLLLHQLKQFHHKYGVVRQRNSFCRHTLPCLGMVSLKFFYVLSVTLALNQAWIGITEGGLEHSEVTHIASGCPKPVRHGTHLAHQSIDTFQLFRRVRHLGTRCSRFLPVDNLLDQPLAQSVVAFPSIGILVVMDNRLPSFLSAEDNDSRRPRWLPSPCLSPGTRGEPIEHDPPSARQFKRWGS